MTDFNQKTHDTDVGSHGRQSRQMMEVFENQKFGSIRLLQEAGKTFFCASDVAKALGYVNPYAAVKRHCRGPLTKREGVVQKVNQYGDAGEQVVEISFITEGDVYRLIVHSKLPSAERFEHWVHDASNCEYTYLDISPKRGNAGMEQCGVLPEFKGIAIFMQLFLVALDKIIFRDYNYNSVIYRCYIGGVQNKRKWNDFRKYPTGSESRIFRKRI